MKNKMKIFIALCLAAISLTKVNAQSSGPWPDQFFGPMVYEACGLDYCAESVILHQRVQQPVTPAPSQNTLPCPIPITCVPSGARLVAAHLWFTAVTRDAHPNPVVACTLAAQGGSPVTLPCSLLVTDNWTGATCWYTQPGYNLDYTISYWSDVTSVVLQNSQLNFGSLNGNYTFDINYILPDPNFDLNGVTLMIIYDFPCSSIVKPAKFQIWHGLNVTGPVPVNNEIQCSINQNGNPLPFYTINSGTKGFMIFGDVQDNLTEYNIHNAPWTVVSPTGYPNVMHNFMQQAGFFIEPSPYNSFRFKARSLQGSADCFNITVLGLYAQNGDPLINCQQVQRVISGPQAICTGNLGPHQYCVTPAIPGSTYIWGFNPPGAGSIVSQNANCVTVNWTPLPNPPAFYTITLTETDANGCTHTASLDLSGECKGIPNVDITICDMTASQFYATYQPLFPANFNTIPGGFTFHNNSLAPILYINGTFTIDLNVKFEFISLIRFGPNAKILMPQGNNYTLTVECSHLEAGCQYMWDGIEVQGSSNTVVVNGGCGPLIGYSLIRDAEIGIKSANGGQVFVDHCQFEDNYIGIALDHSSTCNTACYSIQDNIFYNSIGLYAPRAGQYAHTGIDMNKIAAINIGWNNEFHHLDYGIVNRTSYAIIDGNNFHDLTNMYISPLIKCTECPCPNGTGICGLGSKYHPGSTWVHAGNSSHPNLFTNCSNGIYTNGPVANFIYWNNFQSVDHGITIHSTRNNLIQIGYNTLNDYFSGISCVDNYNTMQSATTDIKFNNFNWNVAPANIGFRAIFLANVTVHDNYALVRDNNIDFTTLGIDAISYSNNTYPQPNEIKHNTIQFSHITGFPLSATITGIHLRSTSRFNILENNIGSFSAQPGQGELHKLMGVWVENSPGNTVAKNTITGMGSGIRCSAACQNSTLACNYLHDNWDGFYFANADISDQLIAGNPQANEWWNNINSINNMEGSLSVPALWWYDNSAGPQFTPFAFVTGLTVNPTATSDLCGTFQAIPQETDPGTRELNYGPIVRDEKVYLENPDENRYNDRQYTYDFFNSHPSALVLGVPDDADYINFYSEMAATNVGAGGEVGNMRDSVITSNDSLVDMSGVILANGMIVPDNVNEANRKIVNEIYMQTWLSGIYEFTPEQEAVLTNIANQNPLFGGNAVYGARVLLGIEPQDVEEGLRMDNNRTSNSEKLMQLYPNPATNEVTIIYQLGKDEKAEIRISSLTGNTIFSSELTPSDNQMAISMNKYSSGVYLCSYIKDGAILERQKLIVIR